MCPIIWNAHRIQSEFLKCTSIIEEYTTNFHSDGILAHSGTSVTGVLHVYVSIKHLTQSFLSTTKVELQAHIWFSITVINSVCNNNTFVRHWHCSGFHFQVVDAIFKGQCHQWIYCLSTHNIRLANSNPHYLYGNLHFFWKTANSGKNHTFFSHHKFTTYVEVSTDIIWWNQTIVYHQGLLAWWQMQPFQYNIQVSWTDGRTNRHS